MKPTRYILLAALSLAGFLEGCKLNETPYDFYSPENLYKTQDDAEAAIAGVYSDLNSYDFFTKPYWEFLSEDNDEVAGPSWLLSNIGSGNYTQDYKTEKMYQGPYVVISRANSVLERVPGISSIDAAVKNRILGEAHFLRAWSYFTLVQLFGPVPLRTVSATGLADANTTRASVADVYKQIIDDLTQAETLMPYQDGTGAGVPGHVNKGAAQALLAKVYATIGSGALKGAQLTVQGGKDNGQYTYNKDVVAGYESFDSKQYYQLARDEAQKLMTSGKYALFTNYMDLWKKGNDNLTEHIFMEQTLPNSLQHGNYVSTYFTSPDLGGRAYMYMDNNYYHSFTKRTDARIAQGITHTWFEDYGQGRYYYYYPREDSARYYIVSIRTPTATAPAVKGDTVFAHFQNKAQLLKYYVPGKTPAPNNNESLDAINYPLLRYADVLLTFAEAENEVNGNTAAARAALLQVRQRANPGLATTDPYLSVAGLSQLQLRSEIFAERNHELYFECNRRFDLQRWGVWQQVMNQIGISKQNVNKNRLPRTLLLPLPNTEVLSSTNIQQNPGW